MPVFLAINYFSRMVNILTLVYSAKMTYDDLIKDKSDEDFYTALETHETAKKEAIETEANDSITAVNDFIASDAPAVETIQEVTTTNPLTMPDYLAQQNELLTIQIQATKNLTNQSKFQNDLLAKSIHAQIVSNANTKMIAETLASSLPALVLQMQQIAKIPATMKIKSEIGATEHKELITTLKALELSSTVTNKVAVPSVVVSPTPVTIKNDVAVPSVENIINVPDTSEAITILTTATAAHTNEIKNIVTNLDAVSEVAKYQTTKALITRLDGSVYAELTPQELSVQKDISLSEAKIKEKEIHDYETTEQAIKNLDGNIVATMKPIEAQAVKNITDAKNATDEMEFEIPDDILDDVFQAIPLPTFTTYDYNKQTDFMFNGGSLDV